MVSDKAFASGIAMLAVAFNREQTAELVNVYHGVLAAKLTDAQWARAVRRSLECESFFPPPAVLLRYGLADGAPQARAVEMYEAIQRAYERGEQLGPREVRERHGTAAMEGFVAAGGVRAFSWCEPAGEPFRRKAFVESWLETVEQEPARALPSGDAPRGLTHGEI